MKWPTFILPDEEKPKPEGSSGDPATPDLRSMSGYPDIQSVRAAAAASPIEVSPVGTTRRARRDAEKKAIEAKDEQDREEALKIIGKVTMRKLASLPYAFWAFVASDPTLALTKAEQEELADAYYLLAKALKPDMNKPKWIIASIFCLNLELVATRMQRNLTDAQRKALLGEPEETKPN